MPKSTCQPNIMFRWWNIFMKGHRDEHGSGPWGYLPFTSSFGPSLDNFLFATHILFSYLWEKGSFEMVTFSIKLYVSTPEDVEHGLGGKNDNVILEAKRKECAIPLSLALLQHWNSFSFQCGLMSSRPSCQTTFNINEHCYQVLSYVNIAPYKRVIHCRFLTKSCRISRTVTSVTPASRKYACQWCSWAHFIFKNLQNRQDSRVSRFGGFLTKLLRISWTAFQYHFLIWKILSIGMQMHKLYL